MVLYRVKLEIISHWKEVILFACILKARSHSKSGGSIWASLECQCCFWRDVGLVSYLTTTHPPAIQKQHRHSKEAHIEPPLFECEWAFRIRAIISLTPVIPTAHSDWHLLWIFDPEHTVALTFDGNLNKKINHVDKITALKARIYPTLVLMKPRYSSYSQTMYCCCLTWEPGLEFPWNQWYVLANITRQN